MFPQKTGHYQKTINHYRGFMKFTLLSALLSVGFLIGQSHAQDTKRIPASVNDVEVLESVSDACGLQGSILERIEDCSEQKKGFALVTRTKKGKEVHKEIKTGLLWGDRLSSTMDHYAAKEACKANLEEVAKLNERTWRLPSKEEYEEAEKNGIRKALPNMNDVFWSSSVRRSGSNSAWMFAGDSGDADYYLRSSDGSARCVAR